MRICRRFCGGESGMQQARGGVAGEYPETREEMKEAFQARATS